eukprot:367934-Amphidinium_carterae.2
MVMKGSYVNKQKAVNSHEEAEEAGVGLICKSRKNRTKNPDSKTSESDTFRNKSMQNTQGRGTESDFFAQSHHGMKRKASANVTTARSKLQHEQGKTLRMNVTAFPNVIVA